MIAGFEEIGLDRLVAFPTRWSPTIEAQAAFAEDCRFYWLEGADWRRILSAITHPWFSCLWASALGWVRFRSLKRGLLLLAGGLIVSAVLHGVYDFLILASTADLDRAWMRHLLTPLLILLYYIMERRLEAA